MILQNGSKMTVEPPRGIKANLLKSYTTINDDFFTACTGRVEPFKFLLFSLCLFHGVALERRKFGPLGFNIPYEFTDGDLRICMSQLKMFLIEYADIPYKVLKYTAGHINYGGRVTDDWDRRCLMNVLEDFYHPVVMSETHHFDQSNVYHQLPSAAEHAVYMAYVKSLPINDTPEIFGLHDNANITFAQNETFRTLGDLVELQPKTASAGGASREEVMERTARDILGKVPQPFNLSAVMDKYPVMYEQSMNTVLVQEIIRYNRLLAAIHRTLQDLLKALKGLVVMSQSLEEMSQSLYNNQVPGGWAKAAYPSLKPLAAWTADLILRIEFIQGWIDRGIPNCYWISGFFFPQAFLTGTLQNYARKNIISIDTISFEFEVMQNLDPGGKIDVGPSDGCYIRGLFIEGARWDVAKNQLGESKAKELYSDIPVIWLIPKVNRQTPNSGVYNCPVYKTLTRAGEFSFLLNNSCFILI
jgi:dynein heavy chain